MFHLNKISTGWEKSGSLAKTINSREDIEKIEKISSNLGYYNAFVTVRMDWWNRATDRKNFEDVDVEEVKKWKLKLWECVGEVNRLKDELGGNLGCGQANMKKLVINYRQRRK